MASFKFTLPTGQPFEIKGPNGLTLDQAKAIFDQQSKSGSLTGFKPGQALSAASQAAAGLSSATSALGQGLSGITGALGAGIPGSTGIVGSISSGLSQVKSLAASATSTITKAISGGIPSSPINIADFTKQNSALKGIGSMSLPTVTGVMAQAKKLVGQGADILSNNKGAGGFGFDAKQLETAGILKPGMAKYVTQGASTLSNLLKSPSAFTGKDGIKSIDGLLSSGSAQSKVQQELMSGGVAGLASQGIPVDKLGASSLAGMSLNAAKSLPT
jgi:hypothetical protein